MFDQDNLTAVSTNKAGFTVWHYDAGKHGEAARTQPGFFPQGTIRAGDAVYIDGTTAGSRRTTHHYFEETNGQLVVWLFG